MSDFTVRACMHEGVVSCAPDTPLEDVAERMRERHLSALVVVRDGTATGIISQTDLVNASFIRPYLRYWRGMTARHLMSAPVVSVSADTPLRDAIQLLRTHHIHRLVVTEATSEGERPVGILSLGDIISHLAGVGLEVEGEVGQ